MLNKLQIMNIDNKLSSKLRNINKKQIKKILFIGSLIVIVLVTGFILINNNFNTGFLDSILIKEKTIEPFMWEETIIEGADFSLPSTSNQVIDAFYKLICKKY